MIGIYKIISPTKRVYIGQTTDYHKRVVSYYNENQNTSQKRLKSSFYKYGVVNHIFEFIEECNESQLNNRERYWQEFYQVLSNKGLNCKYVQSDDKSGKLSDKVKLKISNSHKGKVKSEEHRKNIGLSQLGRKHSSETIAKRAASNRGKIISEEHKEALRIARKNELVSNVGKKGIDNKMSKKVICTKTLKIWDSITECANEIGMQMKYLSRCLNRDRKNKTSIIYLNQYYEQ